MQLKNTSETYGSIAKGFHWITAILYLASYCAIYYQNWLAESDFEKWSSIQLHLSIGITLGGLIVLRIIWRCLNQTPDPEPGSKTQRLAARAGHYILYLIMIIMPLSGYLSIADYLSKGGVITYFLWFDITLFRDVELVSLFGVTLEQLEDPAELVHYYLGAWVIWLLIVGHISAALYHHYIKKDKTLSKMAFQKQ
ncbi:cytochrome b [Kangiella aquimarina]|uniref:Cytochrome b n=1 Tax=Kangiella aquimarina TaxID=261965 RepID=A0ABZ0X5F0_9GAMM|nr:cytochrome b [Kangiella aquimarina]WQG85589.1 cytochrome b [Kangiella aquimarina]